MPSERKIEEYLSDLEKLQEQVREDDGLSAKIRHAQKATEIYKTFRENFQRDEFEVKALMRKGSQVEEVPYDWESLDGESSN